MIKHPRLLAEIASIPWAITSEAMDGIYKAVCAGLDDSDRELFHKADSNSSELFYSLSDGRRSFVVNDTGYLVIDGPIVPRSGIFRNASSIVSVQELVRDFNDLASNYSARDIVLIIDSPGGAVTGVSDLASLVALSTKKVTAINIGQTASAAYWIACAASKIYSVDIGTIGSIGMLTRPARFDSDIMVSSQSPNKYPDVSTPRGRVVVQGLLDDMADVMISFIADRRGISKNFVLENFGQGAMMVASRALEVGMIDGVRSFHDFLAGHISDASVKASTSQFRDLPIVDKSWDSGSAVQRFRDFSGSSEAPSRSYKNGFFWYDASTPDKFGSYKLPFVDVIDGDLVAVRRAVLAANAAMAGARGGVQIPDSDRASVQAHIDRYRAKIERGNNNQSSASVQVADIREDLGMDNDDKRAAALGTIEKPSIDIDAIKRDAVAAALSAERERLLAIDSIKAGFVNEDSRVYSAVSDVVDKAKYSDGATVDSVRALALQAAYDAQKSVLAEMQNPKRELGDILRSVPTSRDGSDEIFENQRIAAMCRGFNSGGLKND